MFILSDIYYTFILSSIFQGSVMLLYAALTELPQTPPRDPDQTIVVQEQTKTSLAPADLGV